MNYLESIVGFLREWIPVEVELLQKCELRGEEGQEFVQVTQLVVTQQQGVQKFILFYSIN